MSWYCFNCSGFIVALNLVKFLNQVLHCCSCSLVALFCCLASCLSSLFCCLSALLSALCCCLAAWLASCLCCLKSCLDANCGVVEPDASPCNCVAPDDVVLKLLATSVAASNFGAAAFNAYAAHSTGNFNRQYKSAAETFSRGQQETNESFNNAWRNVGGKQRPGASSYSRNKQGTRRNIAVTDPFKDIGVPESAPDSQVKAAWLKLMRQHHPDVGGDPRKAQQINAAYQEILRRRGRSDSFYAAGFHFDWEALAL